MPSGDQAGIPYANGAPNLTADIPALMQLAKDRMSPSAARISKPDRLS
jgi:myo-inositol-1-phosphate synthase